MIQNYAMEYIFHYFVILEGGEHVSNNPQVKVTEYEC